MIFLMRELEREGERERVLISCREINSLKNNLEGFYLSTDIPNGIIYFFYKKTKTHVLVEL